MIQMSDLFSSRRRFIALSASAAATAAAATRSSQGAPLAVPERTDAGNVCVLGASGNVGNAIVRELLSAGHRVVAVSRSTDKLQKIRDTYGATGRVQTLEGDVSSDDEAQKLREELIARFGKPRAVVASLSSPAADVPMRILDTSTAILKKAFDTNCFSHVTAAKALIPALTRGGVYVGINGGLSDLVVPGMGKLSMTQSALRALYRVLAQEASDQKSGDLHANVRMLGIYGLVDTGHAPAAADRSIPGPQIGRRIAAIIARPQDFPGPILSIKAAAYS
jgi:NAD(P)-dependent dehydrogenase (short-subunit alcohol dehydrogenase family)